VILFIPVCYLSLEAVAVVINAVAGPVLIVLRSCCIRKKKRYVVSIMTIIIVVFTCYLVTRI